MGDFSSKSFIGVGRSGDMLIHGVYLIYIYLPKSCHLHFHLCHPSAEEPDGHPELVSLEFVGDVLL